MVIEQTLNPTQLMGVVAFFAAAIAAGLLALRKDGHPGGSARVWALVAVAHLAFAAEVVFGTRHQVHDMVNAVLRENGLYPGRAAIQAGLLILCGLCIAIGIGGVRRWLGGVARLTHHARRTVFVTLAVGALFMVESVSLHAIDQVLYAIAGPVRTIAYVWVCAALLILAGAWAEWNAK